MKGKQEERMNEKKKEVWVYRETNETDKAK